MHLSLDEETAVKKRCPDDYGFTVRFHRHCGEGWGTGVSANVPHGGTHDEEGFTVRFHRHCGEGWGTGVSANVPHGGTHDEEKIRESY